MWLWCRLYYTFSCLIFVDSAVCQNVKSWTFWHEFAIFNVQLQKTNKHIYFILYIECCSIDCILTRCSIHFCPRHSTNMRGWLIYDKSCSDIIVILRCSRYQHCLQTYHVSVTKWFLQQLFCGELSITWPGWCLANSVTRSKNTELRE